MHTYWFTSVVVVVVEAAELEVVAVLVSVLLEAGTAVVAIAVNVFLLLDGACTFAILVVRAESDAKQFRSVLFEGGT